MGGVLDGVVQRRAAALVGQAPQPLPYLQARGASEGGEDNAGTSQTDAAAASPARRRAA